MSLEALLDACVACAGPGPSPVPTIIGSSSSPSTGPAPGPNQDNPDHPDPAESGDDSGDRKRSIWDRLFGDSGAEVAEEVTRNVAQDLVIGITLDIAATRLPASAAIAGIGGTVASGAAPLAEGTKQIVENNGYGLGGSSKSGREAMDAAMSEIQGTNNPRPKSRREK